MRPTSVPARVRFFWYVLLSVLVLVPCFWQPRIQAGDLSSHLYNAWLANLIEEGKAPGLSIVPQSTNIAFDILLARMLAAFGPRAAERICVSIAVLVFFWGSYALVSALAGCRPWLIVPCLLMLTHGGIFNLGFFNYYLSFGLSCMALALMWPGSPARLLLALPFLALAWAAHFLPVVGVVALWLYAWIVRRLSGRFQAAAFLASLAILIAGQQMVFAHYQATWSWRQLIFSTGADQVWIHDRHYWLMALALLILWVLVLLSDREARVRIPASVPVQMYTLSVVAVFLAPYSIEGLADYAALVSAMPQRLSLFSAVLACALVAGLRPRRWHVIAFSLLAVVFFGFSYVDAREINRIEDRMETLVASLPQGQRVLARVPWSGSPYAEQWHFNRAARFLPPYRFAPVHLIDRVCIGRCFSYANYEPVSGQFRIRALPGNSIVAADYDSAMRMELGIYIVRPGDLPLYQIYRCGPFPVDLCVRALQAGEVNGSLPR